MSFAGSSSAACAVHPTDPAVATCTRCGNFMCAVCRNAARPDLCDACERVVGSFPLRRESFDIGSAVSFAWQRFSSQWMLPTLMAFGFFVVSYGIGAAGAFGQLAVAETSPMLGSVTYFVSQIVANLLNSLIMAVTMRLAVVALQGHTLTGAHVTQGLRRAPIFIAVQLGTFLVFFLIAAPLGGLAGLGMFQGMNQGILFGGLAVVCLLLLPVMIYVMLGVNNTGIEAVIDPDVTVIEAVRRSWSVADGGRLNLLLSGILSMCFMVAGVIACCVGVVPMWALSMFLWAATYLGLRTGHLPNPTGSFDR